MKTQTFIVEIEMPDGDYIGASILQDDIQRFCDVEEEGRQKVTVKAQNTIRTRFKTRLDCYEQGRQDMREEMMKEAVEGEVYRYDGYQKTATVILVDIPSESLGEKVKIAIMKEEKK